MDVFIERENKQLVLKEKGIKTGLDLLEKLDINPTTVLLVKDNTVILPEEELSASDKIKILSVVSGG